jgi:hypothetical protein
MKPFNLEAALRGEPVATRDGRLVTQLTLFNIDDGFPLTGVIRKVRYHWTQDGKAMGDGATSGLDLFMDLVKREGWVNIIRDKSTGALLTGAWVFGSKELAEAAIDYKGLITYIATVKVEWEE